MGIMLCSQSVFAYDWASTTLKLDGISSIVKTHTGMYAGEFDTRSWLEPYRGIYFSSDLGETWTQAGLKDRGVVGISYDKDNKLLYAATYYSVFDPNVGANRGGLFVLKDDVWHHTGPSVSTAGVLATKDVVLLGTNAHGLWASYDKGENWTQKIGSGYFGPKFRVIKKSGQKIFAHDEFNVYISDDNGNSFSNILPLKNEKIADIEGNGQVVIAGTSNNRGAFISYNNGTTWTKIQQLEGKIVGKLKYFPINNLFYAYAKDATTQDIYVSNDCITWSRTNFISAAVNSIEWVFTEPSQLFASVANDGLYKSEIHESPFTINQIFEPPWDLENPIDLTDNISAFFDHAYPLLGYSLYPEPAEKAKTTTNYLGLTQPEPFLYYSGHDGIDFALPYGTAIKAVSAGLAQYFYQSNGLGHFVKVTHANGYQTFYGHLQEYPAKNFETPQQVEQGQILGKVGMSGRTTGPHLHLTVLKDLNNDSLYENDSPEGKTDPFGWHTSALADPWNNFSWTDALRQHTTDKNNYLWNTPVQTSVSYTGKNQLHAFDGIELDFQSPQVQLLTTIIKRIPSAAIANAIENKKSVPKLAYSIELYNNFGEKIQVTESLIPLIFNYSSQSLTNVARETLSAYHFNDQNNLWEAFTTIDDQVNNKLITGTSNFSLFAVFGDKIDKNPPQTQLNIIGTKVLGTFVSSVEVELTANDIDFQSPVTNTFYKINNDEWQEYQQPIILAEAGDYSVYYKSMDMHQNIEQEKSFQFQIDQALIKHKVKIKNTEFLTQHQSDP